MVLEILSKVRIFEGMSGSQLELLVPLFTLCSCEADEEIFSQNTDLAYRTSNDEN